MNEYKYLIGKPVKFTYETHSYYATISRIDRDQYTNAYNIEVRTTNEVAIIKITTTNLYRFTEGLIADNIHNTKTIQLLDSDLAKLLYF